MNPSNIEETWNKILGFQVGEKLEIRFGDTSRWRQIEILAIVEDGSYKLQLIDNKLKAIFYMRLDELLHTRPRNIRAYRGRKHD